MPSAAIMKAIADDCFYRYLRNIFLHSKRQISSNNEKHDWDFSKVLLDRSNSNSFLSMGLFKKSFIASQPHQVVVTSAFQSYSRLLQGWGEGDSNQDS